MHGNAPLTPEGRLRLVHRIEDGWTVAAAAEYHYARLNPREQRVGKLSHGCCIESTRLTRQNFNAGHLARFVAVSRSATCAGRKLKSQFIGFASRLLQLFLKTRHRGR